MSSQKRAAEDAPAGASAKVARIDGSDELQTFEFLDTSGNMETVALPLAAVKEVPYLQTLVSTSVGTAQVGKRTVELPPGCTSVACRALVLKVQASSVEHLSASIDSDAMDATLALMQTADFLLLAEIVRELTWLCKRQVKTAEDEQKLRALANSFPVATPVVGALDGNALIKVMSTEQVLAMVRAMQPGKINVAQAKVLIGWLQVSGRTSEEVKRVLPYDSLAQLVWVKPAFTDEYKLFPESVELLTTLGRLAAGSQVFLPTFLERTKEATVERLPIGYDSRLFGFGARPQPPTTKYSTDPVSGLPRLLQICFEPLCAVSKDLSLEEVTRVVSWLSRPHIYRQDSCAGIISSLLSRLLDQRTPTFEETKVIIEALLSQASDTSPAVLHGVIGRVDRLLDGLNVSLPQMKEIVVVMSRVYQPKFLQPELPKALVKLIINAGPEAQGYGIESLAKNPGGFTSHITMSFMSKLCADAKLKITAALMPKLISPELAKDVRDFITNAVTNDDL